MQGVSCANCTGPVNASKLDWIPNPEREKFNIFGRSAIHAGCLHGNKLCHNREAFGLTIDRSLRVTRTRAWRSNERLDIRAKPKRSTSHPQCHMWCGNFFGRLGSFYLLTRCLYSGRDSQLILKPCSSLFLLRESGKPDHETGDDHAGT